MFHRLKSAVWNGDISGVRRLLAAGGLPAEPGAHAELLVEAVNHLEEFGEEVLSLLLEAGCDPRAVPVKGLVGEDAPVMAAARRGRLDLAKFLVAAGADLHWRSHDGSNAASAALSCRSWRQPREKSPEYDAMREWLRQQGVTFDPMCGDCRRLMLMISRHPESWPEIPRLVELGVDAAPAQWTPFMWKIVRGTATVQDVEALPEAELESSDWLERTPFLLAVAANRRDLAEALLRRGAELFVRSCGGKTALHAAARQGQTGMIEWLVSAGIPVDVRDEYHHTPLHDALTGGEAAVRRLLELGADATAADQGMFQAIHATTEPAVLALLLDAGADVNAVSGGGTWALAEAALMDNPAAVKFLLDRGALPDLTATGETALFSAVRSDSLECVRLLLDAGADIQAQCVDGWTCLWAVHSASMARFLLERGADPCFRNESGEFPEDWLLPLEAGEVLREGRLNTTSPSSPATNIPGD